MKVVALLLLIALPAQAGETPLAFSARIQSEALAEEAIDLLHCLADRLELPWELNEDTKAPFRLKLEEKDGRLTGAFTSPEGENEIAFGKGESNKICEELTEREEKAAEKITLPQESWTPEENKPRWLLIGATAAAVLVGGFLLWKSRPDHRSFTME